jgi:hypothetical protein
MLCLCDRAYFGVGSWQETRATGVELVWRLQHSAVFALEERLADGSYLSQVFGSPDDHATNAVASNRNRDGVRRHTLPRSKRDTTPRAIAPTPMSLLKLPIPGSEEAFSVGMLRTNSAKAPMASSPTKLQDAAPSDQPRTEAASPGTRVWRLGSCILREAALGLPLAWGLMLRRAFPLLQILNTAYLLSCIGCHRASVTRRNGL